MVLVCPLYRVQPDYFFVNEDGDRPGKREACEAKVCYGVRAILFQLQGMPHAARAFPRLECIDACRSCFAGGGIHRGKTTSRRRSPGMKAHLDVEYDLTSGINHYQHCQ